MSPPPSGPAGAAADGDGEAPGDELGCGNRYVGRTAGGRKSPDPAPIAAPMRANVTAAASNSVRLRRVQVR
jgi:hypothetical protein